MHVHLKMNQYKLIGLGLIVSCLGLKVTQYIGDIYTTSRVLLDYTVLPIAWIGTLLIIQFKLPRAREIAKKKIQIRIRKWALNYGVLVVGVYVLMGFVEGFGRSPQASSLTMVLLNFWMWLPELVGREYMRSYLVRAFVRKGQVRYILIITLLMTAMNLSLGTTLTAAVMQRNMLEVISRVLPEICENILATYLTMYGGGCASVLYLLVVKGSEWFSPILPDLSLMTRSIIGVVVPILGFVIIERNYMEWSKGIKLREYKTQNIGEWIVSAILSVTMLWFVMGVFPIYPSAIATGSMEPMIYPGDIVLVQKIMSQEDIEQLDIGDVIHFSKGGVVVSHRVTDIQMQHGKPMYYTKGDNNLEWDTGPVQLEEIRGSIVGVIPKLGWLSIIVRKGF